MRTRVAEPRGSDPVASGMARSDPAALFAQADAFADAAVALRPAPGAAPARVAPYLMTSVFACELYLKCLLQLAKGKYPQIHNLQALWNDLPDDEAERTLRLHRRVFRDHFPDAAPADADAAFEGIVRGARDAFQISRYLYELGGGDLPDVTPVSTVLRGRILTLEPRLERR